MPTPSVPLEKLTPMLRQYVQLKAERPDVVLLMRVGDFFEAYGDDAELIARELEITLTGRDIQGLSERFPMAGVPFHALERYLARLVQKGFRVAVCDQVEDPKQAKGLVRRKVTRIVTPGTLVEDALLDAKRNNFLAIAVAGRGVGGIGVVDVSTGEFLVTELDGGTPEILAAEIARLAPAECLVYADDDALSDAIRGLCPTLITRLETRTRPRHARQDLLAHFQVASLRGYGIETYTAGLDAAAALLAYLHETHQGAIGHLTSLSAYTASETMTLDGPARRNLELTASLYDNARGKSLLAVLDATQTAMGGRLLKRWLDAPLLSVAQIEARLDAVEAFFDDPLVRGDVRETLRTIADLERLIARLSTGTASARDLAALRVSLDAVPALAAQVEKAQHPAARALCAPLGDGLPEVAALLVRAIVDEPPMTLRDGNLIRDGYDDDLDALREIARGGKSWIARKEAEERERTGIKSLKIGYNAVFGYYIEVSRANLGLVPDDYVRKQTTAQGERFITPELKEMEAKVLTAQEKIVSREYDLFVGVRDTIAQEHGTAVLALARAIAAIDVVAALAEVARQNRYVRPTVDDGAVIEIKGGRHPVVERLLDSGVAFIPNDTLLDDGANQLHVITGPNSAGKSTVLRQVALIVLMAQAGSFVPASAARIGVVDRIFTRVGAHDDLAAGQSTFMVEMTEAAQILHHATERSLVILDEIGRGTSTYDGVSIAWAVAEHLATHGCKTLFATHYHLLNELEKQLPTVRNFRIAVKETDDAILWLRKVLPGGTDKSYGIQVARMAGLPSSVIERAREVLVDLEKEGGKRRDTLGGARVSAKSAKLQMTLFEAETHPVLEELAGLDLSTLSPIEALNLLYGLQQRAKGG
jgi:DNA mismatch repair protein MutS